VVLGLTQSLSSVAMVLAPPLAGWLIGQHWLMAWACTAGGVSAAGFLVAVTTPRTPAAERTEVAAV
jgi:hypothetical protein